MTAASDEPGREARGRPGETSGQGGSSGPSLSHRVSRSVFWNTVLLPVIAVLNLVMASVIRQWFDLGAGLYDLLLGIVNTVLLYTSLGLPTSLMKFLPEREEIDGRRGVVTMLSWTVLSRLGVLVAILLPLNGFAEPLSAWLGIERHGPFYLHLASGLILARACFELVVKTLHAFLAQLWVNLLTLAQALIEPALIVVCLQLGYDMAGVFGALVVTAAGLALLGGGLVARLVHGVPVTGAEAASPAAPGSASGSRREAVRFSLFTYVYELSLYFGSVNFARWALGAIYQNVEPVAVFSAAFQVAFMVVGLVVSGFRGVYRPLFARLRARGDPAALREAFTTMSKAQVALLLPAGLGLSIMVADYLPLLFGRAYLPAVPLARILVPLLFAETAFNLGIIVLSIDERYRVVLGCQSLLLLSAPLFVVATLRLGLDGGAAVMGSARLVVMVIGYLVCRRVYGFRFPWEFTGRVAGVCAGMGAFLVVGRSLWATSVPEATTLTLAGAAIFLIGMRFGGVLGPSEVRLLRRASLPGGTVLLRLLTPASSDGRDGAGAGEDGDRQGEEDVPANRGGDPAEEGRGRHED